jgi:phospholipid/cholesterol/gamma-HCH transport system substrate-binding protein
VEEAAAETAQAVEEAAAGAAETVKVAEQEAAGEKPSEPAESMADFEAEIDASLRRYERGEKVKCTVVSVDMDKVMVELGSTAGIIRKQDVNDDPAYNLQENIKPGDEVEATVVRPDDGHGNVVLSMKAASAQKAWDRLISLLDSKATVTVKINGVKLGRVESIELAGHRVVVTVRLKSNVKIPKDSEIRVQNIGIMGERQIGMILGDSEEYYVPGDTISGQFDAGIAEALGLAGEVCDSTKVLLEAVKTALNGTIANPEFQDRFKTLLVKAENLEDRLMSLVTTTDPQLKKSLANLNKVTVKVNELVDGVKEPINGLFAGTDKVMGNANQLISDLEGVTKHLDGLIAKVQAKMDSKDNTVGILLNDRQLHDDLVKTVHSADSLFKIILQDGLDINVDLF